MTRKSLRAGVCASFFSHIRLSPGRRMNPPVLSGAFSGLRDRSSLLFPAGFYKSVLSIPAFINADFTVVRMRPPYNAIFSVFHIAAQGTDDSSVAGDQNIIIVFLFQL